MIILTNENIPLTAWQNFLLISPHSTPFQTPEFYNLFNSVSGLSANAIAISQSDKILALAVITFQKESGLKGYFSRRCIIYGGPLADPEFPEAFDLLLQKISLSVSKKCIYIETRNLTDYNNYKETFHKYHWNYIPYVNFHVVTSDKAAMINSMSKSRMRQISKAEKSGVVWREAKSVEEIAVFYSILKKLYQTKVKKPLFTFSFFKGFFERGIGRLLLVYYRDEIIGGIMCPIMPEKAIYEFYICGLDKEYKDQYPSVMATWAAMEYANQNNIPLFDFMGAGKHNDQYGVRDFKARFGGELVEYGRFIKINRPLLYKIGKLGLKAIKKFRG